MYRQVETRSRAGQGGFLHTNNASSLFEEDTRAGQSDESPRPRVPDCQGGVLLSVQPSRRRLKSHAYRPGIVCSSKPLNPSTHTETPFGERNL